MLGLCPDLQLFLHALVLLGFGETVLLVAVVVDVADVQVGAVRAVALLVVAVVVQVVVHGGRRGRRRRHHHHIQLILGLLEIFLGFLRLVRFSLRESIIFKSKRARLNSDPVKCGRADLILPHVDVVLLAFPVILEQGDLGHVLCQLCRLKRQNSRTLPERCNTGVTSAALPTAPRSGLLLQRDTDFKQAQGQGSITTGTSTFDVQCALESKVGVKATNH